MSDRVASGRRSARHFALLATSALVTLAASAAAAEGAPDLMMNVAQGPGGVPATDT